MKNIPAPVVCSSCGYEFTATGDAGKRFPVSICPKCNAAIHIGNPLSISVVGEHLLFRSKGEMEGEDYTLSIICSAIAVECFLTRTFFHWKGVESLMSNGHLPTGDEQNVWEEDFPKGGGFLVSADFVSDAIAGMKFDIFVNGNPNAKSIMDGFTEAADISPKKYFRDELFQRRNRILHRGKMNYTQADATLCLRMAIGIRDILKVMDAQKCEKMERDWRQSLL